MATFRFGTATVEGRLQGSGGGSIPPARLLAHRAPPNREEPAAAAAPANGAAHRSKPRGGVLPVGKAARTRRAGPTTPLYRVAVFVSVALNVATLGLLLHLYANHQHPPAITPPHQQRHHTCLVDPDAAAAGGSGSGERKDGGAPARRRQGASSEPAAWAPSTGKPAVTPDSLINLDHGDPTMFEAFWRETGEAAQIVIPGWQTMSYFSDVGNVCWFLEPELDQQVRRLHRLVGNAAAGDGYHVLVGTGSTQLFMAALYALSPPASAAAVAAPASVVSTAPFYSSYPAVTDFLRSGLFRWAGDAGSFKGDAYIELVCSPNNPDGAIREAVLNSSLGKTIHDLAYYWPQYTPITRQADHDIMLFTVSKSTGHAGTRIGWALVKDREIARRMTKFIELNTIGVSKDAQLRAAKVLRAVSDGYDDGELVAAEAAARPRPRLFDFGRRQMVQRWRMLRAAAAASGIFSLPEETTGYCSFSKETASTNPAFAWLRCDREDVDDCASFLRGHKILTRSGDQFGADGRYVRVSMLDRDDAFDTFVQRLSSLR